MYNQKSWAGANVLTCESGAVQQSSRAVLRTVCPGEQRVSPGGRRSRAHVLLHHSPPAPPVLCMTPAGRRSQMSLAVYNTSTENIKSLSCKLKVTCLRQTIITTTIIDKLVTHLLVRMSLRTCRHNWYLQHINSIISNAFTANEFIS